MVPYALNCDSDCRSATVTGTGVTLLGAKKLVSCATPVTRRAMAATAVAKAKIIGRDAGRKTGSLIPNLGCAAGADVTRWKAAVTSTSSFGTASNVPMVRASSDMLANLAWQSVQPA